jgi:hypothetical protein
MRTCHRLVLCHQLDLRGKTCFQRLGMEENGTRLLAGSSPAVRLVWRQIGPSLSADPIEMGVQRQVTTEPAASVGGPCLEENHLHQERRECGSMTPGGRQRKSELVLQVGERRGVLAQLPWPIYYT